MFKEYFESFCGVKQGEPFIRILFVLFIFLKMWFLVFYTILFSKSKDGLQTLDDKLKGCCDKCGVELITDKTKVMIFAK